MKGAPGAFMALLRVALAALFWKNRGSAALAAVIPDSNSKDDKVMRVII
ncbi:hypothetical protein LP419_07845 [Massilia sp. H-1]|nr:hypothetical protein LP419_07845 [Massilia sp. H-1]